MQQKLKEQVAGGQTGARLEPKVMGTVVCA